MRGNYTCQSITLAPRKNSKQRDDDTASVTRAQKVDAATEAKRTLKYLLVCKKKNLIRGILNNPPPSVVKALSNIALNAAKNKDLHQLFTPKQKKLFSSKSKAIITLADRRASLQAKRRAIKQGGGFWIPVLAGAVSALLGNNILGRVFK